MESKKLMIFTENSFPSVNKSIKPISSKRNIKISILSMGELWEAVEKITLRFKYMYPWNKEKLNFNQPKLRLTYQELCEWIYYPLSPGSSVTYTEILMKAWYHLFYSQKWQSISIIASKNKFFDYFITESKSFSLILYRTVWL